MPRAIDLLIDEVVPADIRENLSDLTAGNVNDFLVTLYEKYPDQYKKISHDLARLGARASYIQGETLGLEDFEPVVDKPMLLSNMTDEISLARQKLGNTDEFKKARQDIWVKYNDLMLKSTIAGARASNNKIGHSIISGARGKTPQMQAMLTSPGLYADSKGDIVPTFVENSFADGLRPFEFAAGMFGARATVISTKAATAKGGDYGKLLSQASSRLVVTDEDCGTDNGVAYGLDESTPINRLLSKEVGGFKPGTLLTRNVIADLKKQGINKIVARSPLTCNADGLCSKCVGKTFENKFAKVGEHMGITAANALCLDEDTEVLMFGGGYKKIKHITPGEVVYGVDENGNISPSTVLDNYDRGVQECFYYEYKHQKKQGSLIATKNHRCVIDERDKNYDFRTVLKPLSAVNIPNWKFSKKCDFFAFPKYYDDKNCVENNDAFIIGLMLGDGTTATGTEQTGMSFSCADELLIEQLKPILDHKYNCVIYYSGKHSYRISDKDGGRTNVGQFNGKNVRNKLKLSLLENEVWGLKRTDKALPDKFLNWNNSSVFAVLAGLIVTDGWVSDGCIGFSNTSKKLVDQFVFAVQTRIPNSSVSVTRSTKKGYEATPSYNVVISGKNAYCKMASAILPHMLGVKKYRLEQGLVKFQNSNEVSKHAKQIGFKITGIKPAGNRRTRDLYIDHPYHVFLVKDFIQVHNSEPVTQGALCLAEGTSVLMGDGTTINIEHIKVGDFVMGSSIEGITQKVKVINTFTQGYKPVWKFVTKDKREIKATLDHKVLNKNKEVKRLEDSVLICTPQGIDKIVHKEFLGYLPCYDIEVDHEDHLFVLANNLIVSNSAKHTGGQAVQRGEYGGFEILSQFVQSPKEYKHKAITLDEDGQISHIEKAPQGGTNVYVGNKVYYVKPEYPINVKVGDQLEAGSAISEGIVDVRDVVSKIGLGAGRKYWADRVGKIYKDSGLYADPKNLEIVARGTIDTVNLDEEIEGLGSYIDDTVNYTKLKKTWKPDDISKSEIGMATNKYLAKDTLYHTVGTRITPRIQKELSEVGINEVEVSSKKPPFSPNMDRLRTVSHYNDDWLAGLSTSYLKKQLEDGAMRASTTNVESNQHWAPRVAVGVGFGQNIQQTGKF